MALIRIYIFSLTEHISRHMKKGTVCLLAVCACVCVVICVRGRVNIL